MPKLKTNRGAYKRFKVTKTGKVRFRRAYRNHINTKRSAQKIRHCRTNGIMAPQDVKLVKAMLPYC